MSAGKSDIPPSNSKTRRNWHFWLVAGLSSVLAIVLLTIIYFTIQIIANPEPVDSYTELYILGPDGVADNYPKELVIGENKTLIAYVVNHENVDAYYNLAIRYNNSSTERTAFTEYIVLQDNVSWSKKFVIKPDLPGKKVKVQFQLYKNGGLDPYRECYLWLNVSPPYTSVNKTLGTAVKSK
jgi:uncharacterized membrane protein